MRNDAVTRLKMALEQIHQADGFLRMALREVLDSGAEVSPQTLTTGSTVIGKCDLFRYRVNKELCEVRGPDGSASDD